MTAQTVETLTSIQNRRPAQSPLAPRILVTGANGQVGSDLIVALRSEHGDEIVIGLDLFPPPIAAKDENGYLHEIADITDKKRLEKIIERYEIDTIFHLAGLLSANGEKAPDLAWNANLTGLKNVLDLAKLSSLKVFWPSSIAAFGPNTPKLNTPQMTILDPNTIYGITKASGELLCNYYFEKFGVDVRSLRYPGIISYKTLPGGGTTDYAVEMFHAAIETDLSHHFHCGLSNFIIPDLVVY